MQLILICPIFYKEIYESNLQLIVKLLQKKRVEPNLFKVSEGCILTDEFEN